MLSFVTQIGRVTDPARLLAWVLATLPPCSLLPVGRGWRGHGEAQGCPAAQMAIRPPCWGLQAGGSFQLPADTLPALIPMETVCSPPPRPPSLPGPSWPRSLRLHHPQAQHDLAAAALLGPEHPTLTSAPSAFLLLCKVICVCTKQPSRCVGWSWRKGMLRKAWGF